MEVTLLEIVELSLLFAVPAAAMMLLAHFVSSCITWARQGRIPLVFHWCDLVAPFISTAIWCLLQAHSLQTKTFGNLAEIGYLGMIWGGGFAIRCWNDCKMKKSPVVKFLVVECVITIFVALFSPTLPE